MSQLKYYGLGLVQLWSEIERLTYPVGERLFYLISMNEFEQVAVSFLFGWAMHRSEPLDFTREKDPYFEESLPRPYKEITDLPCKHDRKCGRIDALRTETCRKGTKLLPGIVKVLIQSIREFFFGEGLPVLSFQVASDRAFYIREVALGVWRKRAFRRRFGLLRSPGLFETFFSRVQCSRPPGVHSLTDDCARAKALRLTLRCSR